VIRWARRKLGRRREVELLELFELAWRAVILVSVVALALTPWLWFWRQL